MHTKKINEKKIRKKKHRRKATKGVIRDRKYKDRFCNGEKKKDKQVSITRINSSAPAR